MKPRASSNTEFRIVTCSYVLALIALAMVIGMALPARQAFASTVTYKDTDNKKELDNSGNTYVIQGDGKLHKGDNHFTVPSDSSSEGHPIRITLKNVNVSQD